MWKSSDIVWLAGSVVAMFFPRKCVLCGKPLPYGMVHLCGECMWEMPFAFINIPPQAAQQCFWGRVEVCQVWPLFIYQGRYKELVHTIKYCNGVSLGIYLGSMLGRRIFNSIISNVSVTAEQNDSRNIESEIYAPIDYVIPVPLHWKRKLSRGYNQSEVIACGICRGYNSSAKECASTEKSLYSRIVSQEKLECKVLSQVLYRKSATRSQTRKDRSARWLNVKDAFGVRDSARNRALLDGRHILLVDDVLTTGATLDACASALAQHFNCTISIATLGYVQ